MMLRKIFWFGLVFAVVAGVMATTPAQAQKRARRERVSGPPTLSMSAEPSVIRGCADDSARVQLVANASSSSGLPLRYKWTTNGGRLTGTGPTMTWDLAGAVSGVYQAVVEVDDGQDINCVAFSSVAVVVRDCPPPPPPPPSCPTVSVSCPDSATQDAPVTFIADITGGSADVRPGYHWTVSAGSIISGQGTTSITVNTEGLAGQTIRATLDVSGYGMPCPGSCTVSIPIDIKPRKFDEYYDIARNDEKARLDNYAIQLQSEPGSQGYIIVYPSRSAKSSEAQNRATRISHYLTNSRGIDSSRYIIKMGAARENWLFELWIVPQGAQPPVPLR
jgi:PKD domain-containing protein